MIDCLVCASSHPEGQCRQTRTGQTIAGKYTLGPLLGVGGIAAVYVAHHPRFDREIAVKILHLRYAKDRELAGRFIREARATAAIGHPAFVRVYDAGTTDDGCPFIEMDKLEGSDLYSLRKHTGPLHPERVTQIAIQVLDALHALHARDVIHRDLKTQNIYVVPTPDGSDRVLLLDLGFAKVDDKLQLTSKDQLLGTPFYMSPEQYLDPSAVDARADLFSLGIVLFECLTGKWPYEWTQKRDLLHKVMRGDLERHPAAVREDVPDWLDAIVATVLAHAREERYASALEMKQALEAREPPKKPGFLERLFG